MRSAGSRFIAVVLSLVLVAPGPGAISALAAGIPNPVETQSKTQIDPKQAIDFLQTMGVFKGPEDPIRKYFGSEKRLTPLGEVLYRYLKAQPNPQEEVAGLQEPLKALAKKSGPYDEKKIAETFERQLNRYQEKFKSLPEPVAGDAEDTFRAGTLTQAYMSAIGAADPPKQNYTQVDLPNGEGWEFWDKDGLAFRLNKNKVTVYNRELQKMQREMNKTRPLSAPFVPETGRYNYQMFELSYWKLKNQTDSLDMAMRLDRMLNMAELLGEQYKDDLWFDRETKNQVNAKLENKLETLAAKKVFNHNGRAYSVLDIVNAKTRIRCDYMAKSQEGLGFFQTEMEKLKANAAITDSKVQAMQMSEQYVMRYLSLAYLESQKFAVKNQVERLDPKSPDSEMVTEALDNSPMDAATRAKYKGEGAKISARLDRIMAILGRVEDTLFKSDYAANMDMVQAALNSTQKELGELGLNYSLYVETPAVYLALKTQKGSWLPQFNGTINPSQWTWGWGRKLAALPVFTSGHSVRMKDVERTLQGYYQVQRDAEGKPILDAQGKPLSVYINGYADITRSLAAGNYVQARKNLVALRPDAALSISLTGDSAKITDAMKVGAATRDIREMISQVSRFNRRVDAAANFATWAVMGGFAAPMARKFFSVVEVVANKTDFNLVAKCAEQVRLRLASIEPAQERIGADTAGQVLQKYLRHSAYRMVTIAERQGVFTLLSGTISGVATALSHSLDNAPVKLNLGPLKIGKGDSNFKNALDALAQGAEGGVLWANESFHPALGYIGLPSTYFEGSRWAGVTQTIGERGVVGSLNQGVKYLGGKLAEKSAIAAGIGKWVQNVAASLAEKMRWEAAAKSLPAKIINFPLGMADNVTKYAVFSSVSGNTFRYGNWYWHFDEPDVGTDPELKTIYGLERRIKRSANWGSYVAQSAAWLLLPVFPAKYEEAARGYMRSVQGEEEYRKAGRDAELANAEGDNAVLPMLGRNKPPALQQIFNFTFKGAKESEQNFMVTKEIKRRAINRKLIEHVSGGRKDVAVGTLNAAELLKISRSDPKKRPKIGELTNSDDVRMESRKLCVEVLLKNQALAERILKETPGGLVEGFGRVTPAIQREVAAMLLYELPLKAKLVPAMQALAHNFIRRYLEANTLGKPGGAADVFLDQARANIHETAAESEAFGKALGEIMETTKKWEGDVNAQATDKHYMDLIKELRKSVADKALTPDQHAVFRAMFDLVEAQEARFNSFNNVETTHALLSEELAALRIQFSGKGEAAKNILSGFATKLEAWRNAVPEAGRKTTPAYADPFQAMLRGFNDDIDAALKAKAISVEDAAAIKETVNKDMAGAPWILHDAKNTALQGWRPGQFVAYMTALTTAAEMAKGGAPIQNFIRLTTGGGKTLLAFEGLLPIAEADARKHGMKVVFCTVQSNLDAQAQLEWRALKKVGSALEFDTYEGLKSKIAEAKNKGQKYVEKIWILGDEMDGAALQPALTLGETTGRISRKNPIAVRLEELNERLEQLLGKSAREQAEAIKTHIRQAQSIIDGLDASGPEAEAARSATESLLKAADNLAKARDPQARLNAEEALSARLQDLRSAMTSAPMAGLAEAQRGALDAAADQIGRALEHGLPIDAQALSGLRNEIKENLIRQSNLLSIVKGEPEALVGGLRLEAAQLRNQAESRLETVKNKLAAIDAQLSKAKDQGGLLARKAALESEARIIQGEIQLARRFEVVEYGRAQKLVEKVYELNEQFPAQKTKQDQAQIEAAQRELDGMRQTLSQERNAALDVYKANVGKLYELGRRMAAVDGKILDATQAQKPVASLKQELETLKGEAEGVRAALLRARNEALSQGRITKADMKLARRQFSNNSQDILDLLGKKDAESQALARRLLERRKTLLEAYAGSDNPLYELYRQMKADAYSIARSPIWEREEVKLVEESSQKSQGLIAGSAQEAADALKSLEALSKPGESESAASLRSQAEAMLKTQAEKLNELAHKGPGEREAALLKAAKSRLEGIKLQIAVVDQQIARVKDQAQAKNINKAQTKDLEKEKVQLLKSKSSLDSEMEAAQLAVDRAPRSALRDHLGDVLDLASLQATERQKLLKTLRAQAPALETAFAERIEAALRRMDARDAVMRAGLGEEVRSLEMTTEQAVKIYDRRITELTRSYAARMMKEILSDPLMPTGQRDKLFVDALASWLFPKHQYEIKWSLGSINPKQWNFSISARSSWVREEFMNLIRGYYDDYATVRMDNISGLTNVIHNGQWFETMDNPTRRFWELEYGTDITLPYTHKALSTINDVILNKKVRSFGLSATSGEEVVRHLEKSGWSLGGQGARKPDNVSLDMREGSSRKLQGVVDALKRVVQGSRRLVAIRPKEILAQKDVPPEVQTYLAAQGIAKKDAMVLELDRLPEGPVLDYFTRLRSQQGVAMEGGKFLADAAQPGSTGLLVISFSDTRALKMMRKFLIKTGYVKTKEIAQVFSDAEYLRLNRPQAKVGEQMNLDAMSEGKVKVLLLDTRVGGRGLDLEYKGKKGDTRPEAFKGYTNYEMVVLDPHKMSSVHLLQAEGRIDLGRVLLGAKRNFRLMLDVKDLQQDAVFQDMFRNDELFASLRQDPAVLNLAREEFARREKMEFSFRPRTAEVDLAIIDSYVKQKELDRLELLKNNPDVGNFANGRDINLGLIRDYMKMRLGAAMKSNAPKDLEWLAENGLVERYETIIQDRLEAKQEMVEKDQLRSSSVLQDRPISDPKTRWLDLLAR